ncbi:MAG TPA: FGGY family carbohydrate kinase [Pseudonocardia sp.]|nr:FGGY family carbohydrate kinase [Pseudonocardia sp.]
MTVTEVVVGVDLGTTSSKAVVLDPGGRTVALVSARTPWATVEEGTETTASVVLALALDLLDRAVLTAEQRVGQVRVLGVGVAGMGECGVLLDGEGEPCAPVIAWFDRRGARGLERAGRRAAVLPEQFARRTGLPWDSQASVAKLLWLRDAGQPVTTAHRWLSLPEWVVHRLGADLVREPSLASRTGLVDQATGDVWDEGVRAAGLPTTLLPPALAAGSAAGTLRHAGLPAALRGAVLTVAGHDHPVAALGVGAAGVDELFNSSGTADVVARSLPGALDDDRRELLVRSGLSVGAHVLPATTLLLGGARGGLLLRRVLGLLGVTGPLERDRLDRAALDVGALPPGLEVSGTGPTGDDVVLRMRDDVTPAHVWAAATRHTAAATAALIATIDAVVGPHRCATACGGWTRMESVRAAKRTAIARLRFSDVAEPGVVGAAVLAARAAGLDPVPALTTNSRDDTIGATSGGIP